MTQTRIYFIFCCSPVYLETLHKVFLPWTQQDSNLRRWFLCSLTTQWLSNLPRRPNVCLVPLFQRLPHSPTDLDPSPQTPLQFPFLVSYRKLPPHRFAHIGFMESPFPPVQRKCQDSLKLPVFRQSVKQKLLWSHIKLELYLPGAMRYLPEATRYLPGYQFKKYSLNSTQSLLDL